MKAKKALSEENIPIGKMLSEEAFYDGLKVTAEHIEESVAERISKMQEALLRQLTKELEEHALRTVSGMDTPHREQYEEETEQVPETDMSDFGDYNIVMSHIRNIREKIEDNPSKPVYIQTVWGVGYRFNRNLVQ